MGKQQVEPIILKALLDYENYTRYSPIVEKLDNLEREFKAVLKAVGDYYAKYREAKQITVEELRIFTLAMYPETMRDLLTKFLESLGAADHVNTALLKDRLNDMIAKYLATQITQEAQRIVTSNGSESFSHIEELIAKFKAITQTVVDAEADVCTTPLDQLLLSQTAGGFKWRLDFFNQFVGPLRGGILGHVFARPETGKTTLAISETTFMAGQMRDSTDCVLYLNNEESIERLRLRAYAAMLNVGRNVLAANINEAKRVFEHRGGERLKMIGEVRHIKDVEHYIAVFHPKVVWVDQGPKVHVDGDQNDVTKLSILYQAFRRMATQYNCAIITLGQADSTADNRKWLDLNQLDGSKVGIPAELDFCVGVGALSEVGQERNRYLHLCKNKLSGVHAKGNCIINIETGRYV